MNVHTEVSSELPSLPPKRNNKLFENGYYIYLKHYGNSVIKIQLPLKCVICYHIVCSYLNPISQLIFLFLLRATQRRLWMVDTEVSIIFFHMFTITQVLHYILIIFPRRQKFRLYVYDWCHFLRCSTQHVASCAVRTLACPKHRRPKVIFRTRRTRDFEEKREWLILNISPSMSQQHWSRTQTK